MINRIDVAVVAVVEDEALPFDDFDFGPRVLRSTVANENK